MRWIVVIGLLAILASLFSALFLVYKDRGTGKKRAVWALTIRVGLSLTVFILLLVAYKMGWMGAGGRL